MIAQRRYLFGSSVIWSALFLFLLVRPAEGQPSAETPQDLSLQERVDVRLVQVDVSVTDPATGKMGSIPGLTLDHFDIRLDGRKLTPEERRRVLFDPVCETRPVSLEDGQSPAKSFSYRPVLAVIDFNYLDARGREKVAQALDALASQAGSGDEIFKVYGLTRQTRLLTPGFTRSPMDLAHAAQTVRETAYTRKPIIPLSADGTETTDIPNEGRRSDMVHLDLDKLASEAGLSIELNIELDVVSFGDARSNYNPGASLSALEGIMRAHTYLPGRKVIVLFTSEAFRFAREERLQMEVEPIQKMARFGYVIWTVDVEGISRSQSGASELLSQLAKDTGGRSVRQTGDLSLAFKGATEQLSCYYLFSLPVPAAFERSKAYHLDVRLDTTAYPDLWGKVVSAPSVLVVPDPEELLRGRRVAALLSPGDFSRPRVTAILDYPKDVDQRPVFTSRFRVPLADLEWTPKSDGGYEAQLLVDAVVERDTGWSNDVICLAGSESFGSLELNLPAPPPTTSSAGLSIELPCVFQKNGLYTARGAITDLATRESGGGRSTAFINRRGAESWQVWSPRVEAASGKDFLWRPSMPAAKLDRDRRITRAVDPQTPVDFQDRLYLRHVLCGPDRQAAKQAVRHLLVRRGEEETVVQTFSPETWDLEVSEGQGPFCAPALLRVPDFSLLPGDYAFLILGPEAPSVAAFPKGARGNGILGRAEFSVGN